MNEQWSDAELVRLCLEGTNAELTDDVVAAIARRRSSSVLINDALKESPLSDVLLARVEAQSEPAASADDAGGSDAGQNLGKSGPHVPRAVAGLVVVLVGWLLISVWNGRGAPGPDGTGAGTPGDATAETGAERRPVDDTSDDALAGGQPESDRSRGATAAAESRSPEVSMQNSAPVTADGESPHGGQQPAASQTGSADGEPAVPVVESTVRSEKASPPEETPDAAAGPWTPRLSRDRAPLPFQEVAWRLPGDTGKDEFSPDQFRAWFSPVAGRPFGVLDEQQSGRRFTRFNGMARLNAEWVDHAVLRMAVYDTEACELHVWSGNQGVRLRYYRHRQPHVWAVHQIMRAGPDAPLTEGIYLTNDCGRWHRSQFGVFEVRWENGRLRLTRGTVCLLSVPFPERPEDVTLEGKLKLRSVEMLKSEPFPEDLRPDGPETRPLLTSSAPSRLKWRVLGAEDSPGSMTRQEESIELRVGAASRVPARLWTPTPLAGLCEFIFRIDEAEAGTGVYIGDEQGEPIIAIARLWDPRARRAAVQLLSPNQKDIERQYDTNAWPAPWTGPGQWLRVVIGSGAVSLWSSPDRHRWGWVADSPARGRFPGRRASVGVFAQPQAERRIRISHVEVNEFPRLASTADPELVRRVRPEWFSPLDVLDAGSWLHRVVRHQPQGVNPDEWRRACAVATLRSSPGNELSTFLISGLVNQSILPVKAAGEDDDDSVVGELARSLELLREAALFCDLWDSARGRELGLLYHEVARRAAGRSRADGNAPSVSATVMQEMLKAEFWSGHVPQPTPLDAVEMELAALIDAGRSDRALELIDQVSFWNANGHPARHWWQTVEEIYPRMAWAELIGRAALDGESRAFRQERPGRWKTNLAADRHPLAHSVSKEAYNVMAEFQAAVSGKAYDDACAVISSAASTELLGLLPDSHDHRLMVSFPNAVALAMNQQPQLRRTMNERFGAIGRLRVREAIQNGDHQRIEAATVQFFGTVAAAESAAWLGDRALAAGQFAAARSYFQQAIEDYERNSQIETPAQRALDARLALIRRLSDAGDHPDSTEDTETPLSGAAPLQFNSISVTPDSFQALLKELDSRKRPDPGAAVSGDLSLVPSGRPFTRQLPEIRAWRLEHRGRHDGDQGERPGSSASADVDWVARQLSVEVDGDSAFLCNRFQLSRLDLASGKTQWKQQIGGDHGSAHHWPMVPMRPLIAGDAVYARRLRKDGTEIICCDRERGDIRWTLRPGLAMVSDPFLNRGRLQVFLAGNAYAGPAILELATIHRESGTVLSTVPVLNLFDVWQNTVPVCQVSLADGLIWFTVSGVAGCCNSEGQLLWIRRREWVPPALDRERRTRHWSPPVLHGESVILCEPESPVVERVDAATGRRQWSLTIPGFRRCLAAAHGKLLIEVETGVRAVDLQTGKSLWHYIAADLLDGALVSESMDQLLLVRGVPFVEGRTREVSPTLVWLDGTSGREAARLTLDGLRDKEPRVGPLVSGTDRTWLFFARGRKEANRDIFEFVPDDAVHPAFPLDSPTWSDWHAELRTETPPEQRVLRVDLDRNSMSGELHNSLEQLAGGWLPLMPGQPKESGTVGEFRGQRDVLRLRPKIVHAPEASDEPPSELTVGAVRLFRPLQSVAEAGGSLRFKAGHQPGESWLLTVEANGERLLNTVIDDQTAPSGWQQIDVRMGHLAGQAATIVITCGQVDPKSQPWVFLSELPDPVRFEEPSEPGSL